MTTLKFADTHNMVAFLSKPAECVEFEQIVDFLNANPIRYALTTNPIIYTSCIEQFWAIVKVKTVNGEVQLQALVDGKKIIITESTIKRDLQLEDVEGVDCLPNATIFEQLTLIGFKTTAWNEFSSTMASAIIYEAVYKELDDSLVRAATTSSSLEAKQDNGGGPRRQETMGDTIAKTRFENVSKHSNNLLLRVFDLETTKTTQGNEITSLKRRVKKLKEKNRSRTHKLKRIYKVGLSARVESFGDEKDLGEDASKQGMIADIDDDARITLVSTHFDVDTDMFGVHDLAGDEVVIESEVVVKACEKRNVEEVVDVAQVSTAATTETITTEEITLAQALAELKSAKPKVKGIVFQEPGESITITTTVSSKDKGKGIMVEEPVKMKKKDQIIEEQQELSVKEKAKLFQQLLEKRRKHFAAKRAKEQRNKPPTKAQQKKTMITYLKNMEVWKHKDLRSKDFDSIKELFDKALKRVNIFVDFRTELVEGSSKRAGTELEQEVTKKKKVDDVQEIAEADDDQEATKIKELMEIVPDEEEVAIDAIPLATKPPSIGDLKIMFEPHVEDEVWRNPQGYRVLDYYSAEVNAASENMLEVTTASEYQVNAAS
ncbi:hypothetical protein Tco_0729648 [Tanacetum coccineum]|uniref:Xylulose kinase-1 n=1 Tax=Tanacetum coccineum TaxID=301880 RepID=A0ABQ4YS87_9ASTR